MRTLVPDASVVVDLLIHPGSSAFDAGVIAHRVVCPAHLDAEVLSALARLYRAGDLPAEAVSRALADLAALPVDRVPLSGPVLAQAWSLRHRISMGDAMYVAIAHGFGGKVLTTDHRLRRAAPDLTITPEQLAAP